MGGSFGVLDAADGHLVSGSSFHGGRIWVSRGHNRGIKKI